MESNFCKKRKKNVAAEINHHWLTWQLFAENIHCTYVYILFDNDMEMHLFIWEKCIFSVPQASGVTHAMACTDHILTCIYIYNGCYYYFSASSLNAGIQKYDLNHIQWMFYYKNILACPPCCSVHFTILQLKCFTFSH